jgi:hypothetical protein
MAPCGFCAAPVFWFMMQLAMIAGFVTSYPVNWWLIRKQINGPCDMTGSSLQLRTKLVKSVPVARQLSHTDLKEPEAFLRFLHFV